MVDLVKIRQKAKEKKEAGESPELAPSADAVTKASPSAAPKKSRTTARKAKTPDEAPQVPDEKEAVAEKPVDKPSPAAKKERGNAGTDEPDKETSPKNTTRPESKSAKPKQENDVSSKPDENATKPAVEEEPAAQAQTMPVEPTVVDEKKLDRLEKFKREAGKRRRWIADAARGAMAVVEEEERGDLELLRFRLAGEEYAVDIEKIVEIVPPRGTTRVPNADPTIVGIMSLRGTIVTVFDLRRKLGHPSLAETEGIDPRMIVVEREGETAGFLVDRVSRVVKLDPSEIESHPVVSAAEQSDYVGGVFQATDGLVILLDLEKILASHS